MMKKFTLINALLESRFLRHVKNNAKLFVATALFVAATVNPISALAEDTYYYAAEDGSMKELTSQEFSNIVIFNDTVTVDTLELYENTAYVVNGEVTTSSIIVEGKNIAIIVLNKNTLKVSNDDKTGLLTFNEGSELFITTGYDTDPALGTSGVVIIDSIGQAADVKEASLTFNNVTAIVKKGTSVSSLYLTGESEVDFAGLVQSVLLDVAESSKTSMSAGYIDIDRDTTNVMYVRENATLDLGGPAIADTVTIKDSATVKSLSFIRADDKFSILDNSNVDVKNSDDATALKTSKGDFIINTTGSVKAITEVGNNGISAGNGDVRISGDSKIKAKGIKRGIYSKLGKVIIEDNAGVDAVSMDDGTEPAKPAAAICARDSIIINTTDTVWAIANGEDLKSCGIYANGEEPGILIKGASKVAAYGALNGIVAENGEVYIDDSAKVEATSLNESTAEEVQNLYFAGIRASIVNIATIDTVYSLCESAASNAAGISAETFQVLRPATVAACSKNYGIDITVDDGDFYVIDTAEVFVIGGVKAITRMPDAGIYHDHIFDTLKYACVFAGEIYDGNLDSIEITDSIVAKSINDKSIFQGSTLDGQALSEGISTHYARICFEYRNSSTGINNIQAVEDKIFGNKIYNIAGQEVDNNYSGVVIQNGVKYVRE